MKKIFAIVICIAMMLTMFATLTVNAAVTVAADDTEVQVTFFQIDEYIHSNPDAGANGHNVINYTQVGDSYKFIVSVMDSGVYLFRTDVCSPWGRGAFDVYVDDELVASSGKFAATGESGWNNYAHIENTYINFEDDGEYVIEYVLTDDCINLKLPVISYYDELMPGATQAPTQEPTATPAPTEAPTEVPTEAPTEVPATEAPKATEAPSEEEGGCGSSVAIAQIMLILGAAVVLKKRK